MVGKKLPLPKSCAPALAKKSASAQPQPAGSKRAGSKKLPASGFPQQPACSECARPPVVHIAYQQRNLCRKHFIESFERRVLRTVRDFSLLKKGDHVAVGLSGGKDSAVLLNMLCRLRKRLPFEISALLIDEGISGYREKTISVAQSECRRLGVELTILEFDGEFGKLDGIMKKRARGGAALQRAGIGSGASRGKGGPNGRGACTYCGVFRRHLLNKGCRQLGANKLAIGHNLDDMAQTVLMNVMRNEPYRLARFGVGGGIVEDAGFVPRIKPLAQIPEREVALYASLAGIPIHYQECPYAHEAFRQQVRSMLNQMEEKYPGTKHRIFSSFLSMQKSLALDARAAAALHPLEKCANCGEPSSEKLCMACLLSRGLRQAL